MPTSSNYASLGYVGWTRFSGINGDTAWIRATTADIKLTQGFEKPDVVDGKTDKTIYQVKPVEVMGGVSFYAVHEFTGAAYNLAPVTALWSLAMQRSLTLTGGVVNPDAGDLGSFTTDVKYTTGVGFSYLGTAINSFEFSIAKEENLTINLDLIGFNRIPLPDALAVPQYALRNTRVIGWNDVRAAIQSPIGAFPVVASGQMRSFNVKVANNVNKYYALNGQLYPAALLPTKREISGQFVLMGRNTGLADYVHTSSGTSFNNVIVSGNSSRCTEPNMFWFGYDLSRYTSGYSTSCGGTFTVGLPGCLFEVEEVAFKNDLFETTTNWHCMPGIEFGVQDRDTTFIGDWPFSSWTGA